MAVARGRDTGASTHGCDDNTTGGVSMPTDSLRPALRWGDTALQARAAGEARLQSLLGAMASTHSEAEWSCVWEMWELWVLWEVGVGAVGAVGAVGGGCGSCGCCGRRSAGCARAQSGGGSCHLAPVGNP